MTTPGSRPPRLGHHPIIAPRIGVNVPRLAPDVIERLGKIYVPDLSDAVGALYTMDHGIRPFYEPTPRLIGQALTVKVPPGDNLAIRGAYEAVRPGDVIVVDWRGYVDGCGSGASALVEPISRGLVGLVIDGAWRDQQELRSLSFPLFARAINPFSPAKEEAGEVNVPVCCGGVVVEPGDVIVGDAEGVVVIPRREAAKVAEALSPYEQPDYANSAPGAGHGPNAMARAWSDEFASRAGVEVDYSGS